MTDPFLLVVGPEWIEIVDATTFVNSIGFSQVQEMISAKEWNNLSQYLEDAQIIAPNTLISGARLYNDGDGLIKMWYIP